MPVASDKNYSFYFNQLIKAGRQGVAKRQGIAKQLCSQSVYLLYINLRLTVAVATHGALNLAHIAIPDTTAAAAPVAF